MKSGLDLVADISRTFGFRVLSPGYQILILLHERKMETSGALQAEVGVSPGTFQKYVRELREAGHIHSNQDAKDARRNLFSLTPDTKKILDEERRFPKDWHPSNAAGSSHRIAGLTEGRQKRLKVRIFSTEYQMIMAIYDERKLTTGELLRKIDASPGAAYHALARLVSLNVVEEWADSNDLRRKFNTLTSNARQYLDEILSKLQYRWNG